MDVILGQQGNTRTIASGQDARLIYFSQDGNKRYYLLQGEEDLRQYIDQLNLYKQQVSQVQQDLQQYIDKLNEYTQQIEIKTNEIEPVYKIGNFTIIEKDNNLYIYLKDQVIFKLNEIGLNVKQVNQWNVGTPDLK